MSHLRIESIGPGIEVLSSTEEPDLEGAKWWAWREQAPAFRVSRRVFDRGAHKDCGHYLRREDGWYKRVSQDEFVQTMMGRS